MALTSRQVSVLTTAAVEITDGAGPTLRQDYQLLVVNHDATNPVYLGGSTVSSSTGAKLAGGASVSVDLNYGERLYARATGGTVVVGVLQSKF